MAKSLSEDLRMRVIGAVEGGLSCHAAAARYEVSVASAVRWLRAWRDAGTKAAQPRGGDRHSHRVEALGAVILGAIETEADITLVELCELLERGHGARFAPSTIWRFLDRRGLSFKKNGARSRAGQTRRRQAAAGVVRRPA